MAKKQIVIEEQEDDENFDDDFDFSQHSSDDEDAPVKKAKIPVKNQSKKIKKIRGGDIFAQSLPEKEIKELKAKQTKALQVEEEVRVLEEKKVMLDKRNAKVEKEAKRKSANHIIF